MTDYRIMVSLLHCRHSRCVKRDHAHIYERKLCWRRSTTTQLAIIYSSCIKIRHKCLSRQHKMAENAYLTGSNYVKIVPLFRFSLRSSDRYLANFEWSVFLSTHYFIIIKCKIKSFCGHIDITLHAIIYKMKCKQLS